MVHHGKLCSIALFHIGVRDLFWSAYYNHKKGHLLKTRYHGCDGINTMASCEKSNNIISLMEEGPLCSYASPLNKTKKQKRLQKTHREKILCEQKKIVLGK
jgi:hypothetical protein